MTNSKTITWQTGAGQAVEVVVAVERKIESEIILGLEMDAQATEVVSLVAKVDGRQVGHGHKVWAAPMGAPSIVAGCIGKLCMTADNKTRIETAINQLKAIAPAQDWADMMDKQNQKAAKAEKELKEYYAHNEAVNNMMTLNGNTY